MQDEMVEHADDHSDNTDSEDELDIIGDKFVDKFVGGGINIDASGSESDWVDENMDDSDELNIDDNTKKMIHVFILFYLTILNMIPMKSNVCLYLSLWCPTLLVGPYHVVIKVIMNTIVQQC